MSALVFDNVGDRFYEMGVSNVALYLMKNSFSPTDNPYLPGVAWNGITAINENPEGAEPTDLWADDIKYATLRSTESLKYTIEAYMYPDEFAECDGQKQFTEAPGVFVAQQKRRGFGLVYKSKYFNDTASIEGERLSLLYNSTASPTEKAHSTINDSPDIGTMSWEASSNPVNVGFGSYKPTSKVGIDLTEILSLEGTKYKTGTAKALSEKIYGGVGVTPTLLSPKDVYAFLNSQLVA